MNQARELINIYAALTLATGENVPLFGTEQGKYEASHNRGCIVAEIHVGGSPHHNNNNNKEFPAG